MEQTMSARPHGKEAVRAALIEAAGDLFARNGILAVSVRDIAKRAQVNHGLIHRHFGSRDGVVQAAIEHMSRQVISQLPPLRDNESLLELLQQGFQATARRDQYWKVLAHIVLTEGGEQWLQKEFPLVERMLRSAQKGKDPKLSPAAMVTLLLSLGLGMLVFEPYLKQSMGLSDEQWLNVQREVLGLLVKDIIPPSNGS